MSKENRKLTRAIRERMERTHESYSTARMNLLASIETPSESPIVARPRSLSGTAERIQGVLDALPDLTYFGFRAPGGEVSRVRDRAKFNQERAHLLDDDGVQQVEKCLAYLAPVRKAQPDWLAEEPRDVRSSYGMKHEVESWLRRAGKADQDSYIANGAFIVAAILAEFPVNRGDVSSPNLQIGVNSDDIWAIEKGKDPAEWRKMTAFVAWLFEQAGRGDDVGMLGYDCKHDLNFPRTGNITTIRAYLRYYGDHVQEWFKTARGEYKARGTAA